MRVYQAHISQNKLEIAHLQLDLDWCNRRLLRIMGVAGSRKGKGSSKFCRKEAQPFWNAVGICWNLLCRICRSAVNFCAVPCVDIRGEVWVSTGFHRRTKPDWAPGIDQHWKVLRNGARSYKLRRGHHTSQFRWRWLNHLYHHLWYGVSMVIPCEVNWLTIKHRTSKTHEYEWCLIGDSSNQDQLGNIRGNPLRNQPL